MKILYDHQAFTMQTHGGISRSFVELCHHLPQNVEATISVLESDNIYIQWLDGIKPSEYQYHQFLCGKDFRGKGYLHRWYDKLTRRGYYPDYNKKNSIRLLQESNFDVFHPTFYDDYFLPYLNGKPFVLTIHDLIAELFFESNDMQVKNKRRLAEQATQIVAVSNKTKEDIINLFHIPDEKITVIYHGTPEKNAKGKSPMDNPYLLYVGERQGYKAFIPMLKGLQSFLLRHPEIHIICTGRNFTPEENIVMKTLGIDKRIHQSFVSDIELYNLYANALCFIYPSFYEGFGIPILEAYNAQCPVILNNASCFPEIAGDAAIYFQLDENGGNLSEVMEYFISTTPLEKNQLLEKQNKRLQLYSWEKSAQELYQVYLRATKQCI